MFRLASVFLVATLSLCFASSLIAQPKGQKDSAKKNYKDELPHIPPKSPAEALKTFRLHAGYSIQLVAAEPLIRDPVAIAFDPAGRIYVCEMPEYNQYANKSFRGMGSVKLLQDKDGDGRYETATPFLAKIASPCAIACYDGGVFVGSVPKVLYCKDTNGDGVADIKKVVYKGFARDRAGEAMMNSIRWGLDNRFHMSTSLAGGNVALASPGTKARSVRGRGFRFDPRSYAFDLTSGGGQHGMSMDDWGRKFVCSNSNPAQTLIYDDRYLPRNPYLAAPAAAINITAGKYTKIYRISKVEPWRVLRTRLRSKRLVPGGDEGGKPAGFFTASTGVTIFRGSALGEAVRGNLLVGEVASNMIYRARLSARGVSLSASRLGPATQEFLASTDNWFRPVQMAHGPDGNLYVVDMYRELIEGAAFLPDIILKHLNVAGGIKRGRIYRVVRTGYKHQRPTDLSRLTTAQLVQRLNDPNGWTRDTASRLIYQRQDRAVVGKLRRLLRTSDFALGRIHALGSLVGLGQADESDLLTGLTDKDQRVREASLRMAESKLDSAGVRQAILKLENDRALRVRFQLAFTLGDFPANERTRIIGRMLVREGTDRWIRLGLLSSAHPIQAQLFAQLAASPRAQRSHIREILTELVSQVARIGKSKPTNIAVAAIERLYPANRTLASNLLQQLALKMSPQARRRDFGSTSRATRLINGIVARARQTAVDETAKPAQRVVAIGSLNLAGWKQIKETVTTCLDARQPLQVQLAALQSLAGYRDQEVPRLVLRQWRSFGPQMRARATELLLSRTDWVKQFLNAYQQGTVRSSEVDFARMKLLARHRDKSIAALSRKLFSQSLSKRANVVKQYQSVLKMKGSRARGKLIFKKNCSACHKLEGVGNAVGADLKAIKDRGSASILLNILDPNREVKPKFVNYVVTTGDGVVLTGMILQETANSITLRKADGSNTTLLRVDIERIVSTGISFMPEGLEKKLGRQDMADLIAYLNSIEK